MRNPQIFKIVYAGYNYEISNPPIKCRFQHPIQFVENLETRGGVTSCYKFAVDIKIEKRVLLFLFRTLFYFLGTPRYCGLKYLSKSCDFSN